MTSKLHNSLLEGATDRRIKAIDDIQNARKGTDWIVFCFLRYVGPEGLGRRS